MTTYQYTVGSYPAPAVRSGPTLIANTAFLRSSLTGAVQTVSRPGEFLQMSYTWRNITRAQAGQVVGFFMRLNGGEHRVQLPIYGAGREGAYGGSPVVNGFPQTGNSLICDGATPGVTDWAKAGDFFSFDNGTFREIKIITADASSDGGGNVTLNFIPAIRISPANSTSIDGTVTGAVYGDFILRSSVDYSVDARSQNGSTARVHDQISLDFIEQVEG